MIYELLIRGKADGTISGSHVREFIDGKPGLPRAIRPDDWPGIAKEINAAMHDELLKAQTDLANVQNDFAAYKAKAEKLIAAGSATLASDASHEEKITAFSQIVTEATATDREKAIAAAQEKLAAAQNELAALAGNRPA